MPAIVIDLGSTFIKGAVADLDACRLGSVRRHPFPPPLTGRPAGFFEVNPEAVAAAFTTMLDALLEECGTCEGLFLSTQMHGLVITSERGEALSPVVTWQDTRAAGACYEEVRERIGEEAIRETGNDFRPGLPVCALYWMARENALPARHAIPAGIADFVLARLSETASGIDQTNAASHGALDLARGCWHAGVVEALGLGHLAWPEIHGQGTRVCTLTRQGQTFPCYAPVGDSQAALAGVLLAEDELSLNISTGSQAAVLSTKAEPGDCAVRPFFDGKFLRLVAHVPAGLALQALLDLLCEIPRARGLEIPDPWDYVTEAVSQVRDSGLDVDLSFYPTSFGDRGGIGNIQREELTVGHFFHSAYRGLAENYAACLTRLAPDTPPRRIAFSGGLARRQEKLREMIATRLDLPYRQSQTEEEALAGLLVLGRTSTGRRGGAV